MFFQRRGTPREPVHGAVNTGVKRNVEMLAARFNCSKSFVVNTLLARQLGIVLDEEFYDIKKRRPEARSGITASGKRKGKRAAAQADRGKRTA